MKSQMSDHETPNIANLEARLIQERNTLLARMEEQLRQSDDPKQRALANTLREIDDWTLADPRGGIDVTLLGHELCGLREIDAALKRIARGAYGLCSDCGKPINVKRLNAQPAARLCLACKEAFEKRRGIVSPRVP